MASAWKKLLRLIREFCAGIDEAHGILHGVTVPERERRESVAEAAPQWESPRRASPPPVREDSVAAARPRQPAADLNDSPPALTHPTAPPRPLWPRRAYRGMCSRRAARF